MPDPTGTVEVVSPEFPCGQPWLANALIELSVPLPHLWGCDTRDEWIDRGDGTFTYMASHLPWRQALASLRVGRTIRFRTDSQARFSHGWPWQIDPATPVILIVRDPRDALHSEWRRHQRNLGLDVQVGLPEFAAMSFLDTPIAIVDALWAYLASWIDAMGRRSAPAMVLRFEDWKQDAVGSLARATRFMQLDCAHRDLARAAAASEVSLLQQLERDLLASDPSAPQLNRRGQAYEWKEVWRPEWDAVFAERWRAVFDALRYDRPAFADGHSTDDGVMNVAKSWWKPIGTFAQPAPT